MRDQKIVMLTDIFENDESKCAIYFPQTLGKTLYFVNNNTVQQRDEKQILNHLEEFYSKDENWLTKQASLNEDTHFNYFCIKNIGVCTKHGYSIRKLHCMYKHYVEREKSTKTDGPADACGQPLRAEMTKPKTIIPEIKHFIVHHYWFQHWPDHRSPQNIDVVLDMCLDVLDSNCADDFKGGADKDGLFDRVNQMFLYDSDTNGSNMTISEPDVRKITATDNFSAPGPLPIIHW